MKKKIIIGGSIIIVIIGGYLAWQGIFNKKAPYTFVEVTRGNVEEIVSVTGTVVSDKQIDLEFENSGKIKKIEVAVGDKVLAGQVLVRLDTAELNAEILSRQAALDMSRAKLAQTLAGAREEDIQVYRTAVEKAQVDLLNEENALSDAIAEAENDLISAQQDALDDVKKSYTKADKALLKTLKEIRESYFNGSSQLALNVKNKEIGAKEDLTLANDYLNMAVSNPTDENIGLALNAMQAALESIREALAFTRAAMDDPAVNYLVSSADKTSVDTDRTSIDTEIVNLTSASQAIESIKITNRTDINAAQANLDTAKAALKNAQNELALKEASPRQADIDLAKAEVKQAEANLLQSQAKLSKSVLRAPVKGLITAIKKEEGEVAQVNTLIISMISEDNFQVEANVSETEIAKVKLQDIAEMTLDALGPDEKFEGRIIEIDPAETVVSGVIYYKIKSVFDAEDGRIKSGMTVNLDIVTDKKENVLSLPYFVIKQSNGNKYVEIFINGQIEKKTVQTGLEGETMVEVIDGLSEGEKVISQ
ncbi:efflux RND transporter periplasmic adaptor subunit [Patescibacteria group bacterium]|nr:efflux RND transporter periplasmic adaptor subunit [Patescibacteria group bacterium]